MVRCNVPPTFSLTYLESDCVVLAAAAIVGLAVAPDMLTAELNVCIKKGHERSMVISNYSLKNNSDLLIDLDILSEDSQDKSKELQV